MTKHTPGPWWKTYDGPDERIPGHNAHGCQKVVMIGDCMIYSKDSVPHAIGAQEAGANANVIAAAPKEILSLSGPEYLSRDDLRNLTEERDDENS